MTDAHLQDHIASFVQFRRSTKGLSWIDERAQRKQLYQRLLNKEQLPGLTEIALKDLIKGLWATNFWGNKEYKASSVIAQNQKASHQGHERIRDGLAGLLHGAGSLAARYDEFRKNIKGLGTSSLTEIMCFAHPSEYCIWNDKPQTVLPVLQLSAGLPERVFKNPMALTGKDYEQCCATIRVIKDALTPLVPGCDFTDADCFLWYMFDQVIGKTAPQPPQPGPTPKGSGIVTHGDAQAALLRLGNLLAYDTYVADPNDTSNGTRLGDIATLKDMPAFTYNQIVETARYIDVIWFKDDFPECCFEVEHTTDVTKGLLRLYQVRQLQVHFFIIAQADKATKFTTEISKDPFKSIKHRYAFRSYEDLNALLDLTEQYTTAKDKFFPGLSLMTKTAEK